MRLFGNLTVKTSEYHLGNMGNHDTVGGERPLILT